MVFTSAIIPVATGIGLVGQVVGNVINRCPPAGKSYFGYNTTRIPDTAFTVLIIGYNSHSNVMREIYFKKCSPLWLTLQDSESSP